MPSPKKHRLAGLEVTEISLVDRGANPGAKVLLYKREGSAGIPRDVDAILKLEVALKGGSPAEIRKDMGSITKDEAFDMVKTLAGEIQGEYPNLTLEQCVVKAVDVVPRVAALAGGKSLEMVTGR